VALNGRESLLQVVKTYNTNRLVVKKKQGNGKRCAFSFLPVKFSFPGNLFFFEKLFFFGKLLFFRKMLIIP